MRRILRELGIGLVLAAAVVAAYAAYRSVQPRVGPEFVPPTTAPAAHRPWRVALAGLGSAERRVRYEAAETLADLESPPTPPPAAPEQARAELATLMNHINDRAEDQVARQLLVRALGSPRLAGVAGETVGPLVALAGDRGEPAPLRAEALHRLAALGADERARAALLDALDDPNPTVRYGAVAALERHEAPAERLIPALARIMGSGDAEGRASALRLAGQKATEDRRYLDVLAAGLRRPEQEDRRLALSFLPRLGPSALPLVPELERLAGEADPNLRFHALDVLDRVVGGPYAERIVAGLRSRDPATWQAAYAAMQREGPGRRWSPTLRRLLGDPDPSVRVRAAALMAGTRSPQEAYAPVLERSFRLADPDTQAFCRLRFLLAGGRARAVVTGERIDPDGALFRDRGRLLGLLAIVGVLVLIGGVIVTSMRVEARRMARPPGPTGGRRLNVDLPPVRVRLVPIDPAPWTDPATVQRHADALRALGFTPVGPFAVDVIPDITLLGFVRPADAVNAIIEESPRTGLVLQLYTRYPDGRQFNALNRGLFTRLSRPPGRTLRVYDGADFPAMLGPYLAERPDGPFLAVRPETFAPLYEQSYADTLDWRNAQGGWTAEDLRVLAELHRLDVDDAMIAECVARLAPAALDHLDLGLRYRYLEAEGIAGADADADADAMLSRLVVVHDGLPPERLAEFFLDVDASSLASLLRDPPPGDDGIQFVDDPGDEAPLAPRLAFARLNRRQPDDGRHLKVGELTWPLAADVYLAPEG